MRNSNKRTSTEVTNPDVGRLPAKRFRIQKLEERIAPKKGGNGTNKCDDGGGDSGQSSGFSGTSGPSSIF